MWLSLEFVWRVSRRVLCVVILAILVASGRAQKPATPAKSPQQKIQDTTGVVNGVYRNTTFGFSYKLPYGWVDRTVDMSEGAEAGKSIVLLSAFERPPEAISEGVNSAVVIAAESVKSYPGLKAAEEYFGPLTELTTSKGFKVVNEPYAFSSGTKEMVRSDFVRELGSASMHQSSLVILQKGFALSFTFIGGSEDEVNQLIENL